MARQVNTRFVLMLSTVLAVLIGIATAFWGWQTWQGRDPYVLLKQANEALARGDKDAAITYMTRLLPRAWARRMPDTERICVQVGDLYYETATDGARYKAALGYWQQALVVNPKYKEAIERLLREHYQLAVHYTTDWWPVVEKEAGQLLEVDPTNGAAYVERAEAILNQSVKADTNTDERQAAADKDLQQAMKLLPHDARAYALLMRLHLFRAELAERRGKKADKDNAKVLRDKARKLITDFCAANPADPAGYEALIDLHIQLKELDEAQKVLATARGKIPAASAVFEAAKRLHTAAHNQHIAAHQLTEAAADMKLAAEDLKQLIALHPDQLELYVELAHSYEDDGNMTEALPYFMQVFSRKPVDVGCTMLRNEGARDHTLFALPWCQLDAAEQEGPASAKGKAHLADAANGTGELRKKIGANTPLVSLLEGRTNFLKNQLQQAIPALRRADEGLANANRLVWLRCKLLLADAYTKQTEYGTAMKYVDDVLQQFPGTVPALQRRVRLLLHVARYDDALRGAEDLLREDPKNPATLQLKATALAGLGRYQDAELALATVREVGNDSPQAVLQLAQMQLFRNEPDEVVVSLIPLLEKEPNNDKALLLMSIALVKLERKPEARSYLEKGLAKYPDNVQMQMLLKTLDQPAVSLADVQKQVIQNIPDLFERHWAWVQYYSGLNDYPNELASLRECEKVRSDSDVVIDRIFSLAIREKDWDLAERYAQRAASLNLDGVSGKLFQGRLEYARGDKKRGIETLRTAVTLRDDYSMGWTILGQAYADMQNNTEAINALQTAVSEKPDNIYALKTLIALYINQHDDNSIRVADNYLRSALRFAPRDPQLRIFDDLVGKPKEAIEKREALRKIDPRSAENLRRLAVLYTKDNQVDKAVATLADLAHQHPEDLNVADALARLYRDQGHTNDALKLYEPFLASGDTETQFRARILLGDMHRSMQQVSEAIALYDEAAAKDKGNSLEAQRRLADMYFELEDMPHAEDIYQKIYKVEGTRDIRVLRRYVETLIRQDKFTMALDLLQAQVLKDRPDDAEGLVLRGYALLRQHQAREALASFEKVLDANPDNTDALHYRAFTNFTLMNNHAAAINDLLHIRAMAPNAINSRLLLARVYYADKQFPEAAHEYQEVLGLRPDMSAARLEYAEMLMTLAQLYVRASRTADDPLSLRVRAVKPVDTLANLLQDSIRRFPRQAMWPTMLGNLYGMTGDGERAIAIHKAAFLDSGKNLQIGLTYINTLNNMHRYQEAVTLADELLQVNSSVELYIRRGTALAALGKTPEALDDFTHAADLTRDVNATVMLARQCCTALGAEGALKLFRQRVDKNPKDFLARVAVGMVHAASDNSKAAVDDFLPLLADTSAAPARPVVLRMLAMGHYQLKIYDKALTYYEQLIGALPDDLEALNNVAYLLAEDLKRPEDALKYAQRAKRLIEDRPVESSLAAYSNVMDTVGWVKFLADDVEGASDDLQRSLQMNPLPICYYHLARLYQKQHRLRDAKAAAEQCVKLGNTQKDSAVPLAQSLLDQLKKTPPAG